MMEKYGVDKENDDIEKKAQEMIKEGKLSSIDQARKKAKENKDGQQLQS